MFCPALEKCYCLPIFLKTSTGAVKITNNNDSKITIAI